MNESATDLGTQAIKAPSDIAPSEKPERPFLNLICSVALPALILSKLSDPNRLGPAYALALGLSLPIGYGIFDFATRRKLNAISLLGFTSILLSGSFGLMKLDGFWFAVKDAAIPALMGVAIVFSLRSKSPLVKTLLYNDKVIDVHRVDHELAEKGNFPQFEALLKRTTWYLASSFLLSSILNFFLALMILKSPSGTPEFNKELGKMTMMSYPVIVVPCMLVTLFALWRLLSGIKHLTGLDLDTIFKSDPAAKKQDSP